MSRHNLSVLCLFEIFVLSELQKDVFRLSCFHAAVLYHLLGSCKKLKGFADPYSVILSFFSAAGSLESFFSLCSVWVVFLQGKSYVGLSMCLLTYFKHQLYIKKLRESFLELQV